MPDHQNHVAAIAVVDLARELKRHAVINLLQIQSLDTQLANYVAALENHQDMSELMEIRYPESWLLALWQLADKDKKNNDIGICIGATISLEAQGLLANLMTHCDTLREVLTTYLNNISLVNASESWDVHHIDNHLELVFNFMSSKYPRCAIERSMVSLYQWGQHYCKRTIPLCSVEFAFEPPSYIDQLEALFNCKVHFNSHRNALILTEEIFSWVLPQRNRYIKNMLAQQISDLDLSEKPDSIERKVRKLIRKDLSAYCHIDKLSQSLCMSRTTLYRKLKTEGSNFSNILDEERQRILNQNQNESVVTLCDLLGFKDASAYYKARKRWDM